MPALPTSVGQVSRSCTNKISKVTIVTLPSQVLAADPGCDYLFTASYATKHTSKIDNKSSIVRYSSAQYFQEAHVTTANAKKAKWQADAPCYCEIMEGLQPISPKTTSTARLEVRPVLLAHSCRQEMISKAVAIHGIIQQGLIDADDSQFEVCNSCHHRACKHSSYQYCIH